MALLLIFLQSFTLLEFRSENAAVVFVEKYDQEENDTIKTKRDSNDLSDFLRFESKKCSYYGNI